ncbi:VanZ family protein [Vallitalea longa]|nr:VanZ family protein [Vallitalea longa]
MSKNTKCLIDLLALAIIYFRFFYGKWKIDGKDKLIINTTMYIYISFVLYFTLMPVIVSIPSIFNHRYVVMNMNLLEDYFAGRGDTVRQILLNIIMMVPFGFLLPIIKKRNLWFCILWTFLFSLGIEILQPLFVRSGDITDLVTNTIGGILGYVVYSLFKPIIERIIFLFHQ